jgi:hypothetical protein
MDRAETATVDEMLTVPMIRRFWDALARFLGVGFLREVMEDHADPLRASKDLVAPATFFSTLSRAANASADRLPPPADKDFGQLGLCVLEILQTINRATLDPALSPVADIAKDVVGLLAQAKSVAGTEKVAEILGGRPDSKLLTLKAAFAIMGILRVCYAPLGGTFEERVNAHAAAIKNMAESVYKPLLMRIVDLDGLVKSSASKRAYLNLGPLLGDVEKSGHGILVDRDAYLVRNAEAHGSITIDPDREHATFLNAGGACRELGPWTEAQIHACSERFLVHSLTLFVALLGFIADEAAAWIEQEHPEWLRTG